MVDFHKEPWTKKNVEAAIERDDPEELSLVPIVISLYPSDDCFWSESICIRLATHPHSVVRGNAILGFGHLARVCRKLDKKTVKPLIMAALRDPNDYVRGQANAAKSDVQQFLRWRHFGNRRREQQ